MPEHNLPTAQLVIVGYDRPTLEVEFRRFLERHNVGGVMLQGDALGAPDEVRALTAELQAAAQAPLFVAIDQEGGRVQAWGPPHMEAVPAAAQIGLDYQSSGELFEVTLLAMNLGRQLAVAGINLDFAPVLDVHTCAENPIIGDRSFGSTPELVAELGGAFVEGLQAAGVLACGKHFPGHGDTALDSHLALPVVDRDAGRLQAVELLPFAAAMSRGLETIMTAHVLYPAWDAELPATLSPAIVGGVLRDELGFSGLVIADDLKMAAVRERFELVEAALLALDAGCDVVLSVTEPKRREDLLAGLEDARASGRLSDERLEQSLLRIARVKHGWL